MPRQASLDRLEKPRHRDSHTSVISRQYLSAMVGQAQKLTSQLSHLITKVDSIWIDKASSQYEMKCAVSLCYADACFGM